MTLGEYVQAIITRVLNLVAAVPAAIAQRLAAASDQPALVLTAVVLAGIAVALAALRITARQR